MIEKLEALIKEWEAEAEYLSNPWNAKCEQCVWAGRLYSECAGKLKEVLNPQTKQFQRTSR